MIIRSSLTSGETRGRLADAMSANKTKSEVSVVMASYNHENFISDSIRSVLEQNFGNLELIIVDDASSDRSREIIESFSIRDPRVRSVFHDKNEGIARTFNDGLNLAGGRYAAITASDDVWLTDKLRLQMDVLERNRDLVVWSEAVIIDTNGTSTGELFTTAKKARHRKKSGDIFEELIRGNFVSGQSLIFRRDNLGTIRFDETLKYLNDYKFVLDLAKKFRFFFIDEPLVMYRVHPGNTINSDQENWRKDILKFGSSVLDESGERLSAGSKARIHLAMAAGHLKLGDEQAALNSLAKAASLRPLSFRNIVCFLSYVKNRIKPK